MNLGVCVLEIDNAQILVVPDVVNPFLNPITGFLASSHSQVPLLHL